LCVYYMGACRRRVVRAGRLWGRMGEHKRSCRCKAPFRHIPDTNAAHLDVGGPADAAAARNTAPVSKNNARPGHWCAHPDSARMWGMAHEGPNAPASSSAGGSMMSSSRYTLPRRSCGGARRDPLSSSARGSGSSASPCMTCLLRRPSMRRPLLTNCRSPGARRPSLPMLRAGRMQGPRGASFLTR